MCGSELVILSLVIILLTIIILLLLYLLSQKICLWELTKLIQVFTRQTILRFYIKQSRATRHPSQLNGRNYIVRHIFCRRTPPPPKLNLPLINFGVINFFVDLGPSPVSRTVVPRFNRVGSYFPENSTATALVTISFGPEIFIDKSSVTCPGMCCLQTVKVI